MWLVLWNSLAQQPSSVTPYGRGWALSFAFSFENGTLQSLSTGSERGIIQEELLKLTWILQTVTPDSCHLCVHFEVQCDMTCFPIKKWNACLYHFMICTDYSRTYVVGLFRIWFVEFLEVLCSPLWNPAINMYVAKTSGFQPMGQISYTSDLYTMFHNSH